MNLELNFSNLSNIAYDTENCYITLIIDLIKIHKFYFKRISAFKENTRINNFCHNAMWLSLQKYICPCGNKLVYAINGYHVQ
jgi:hypothetical protein